MQDMLELMYGRYNGGQVAPIGSYLNPRTLAIVQLTADGTLPQDGIFVRVDPSGTQTFANIAMALNALLGTSYTAGSFHSGTASDNVSNPGLGGDDA
jgi:hypothetical protein